MLTTNIIILALSVIALLVSVFFATKPQLQYWIRLISSILIVCSGEVVVENLWGYSWVISLVIMVLFLLVLFSIVKALENAYKKNVSKKNS